MFRHSKQELSAFRRSLPGQRFQDRYWRHRKGAEGRSMLVRVALLFVGALLALLGIVMLFIPGPGLLFIALGGALAATESLTVARVLDWTEVDLRAVIAWLRRRWKHRHVVRRP